MQKSAHKCSFEKPAFTIFIYFGGENIVFTVGMCVILAISREIGMRMLPEFVRDVWHMFVLIDSTSKDDILPQTCANYVSVCECIYN